MKIRRFRHKITRQIWRLLQEEIDGAGVHWFELCRGRALEYRIRWHTAEIIRDEYEEITARPVGLEKPVAQGAEK